MEPEYLNPDWSTGGRVHNWKNYVSDEVRAIWHTFTSEQKKVLYEGFVYSADNEDWD